MEIEIKKLDHQGRGIGYVEEKVTFVENALPEEIVSCEFTKQTKNYNEAKIKEYKKLSLKRKVPFCPYYDKCGGCQLQHLSYEDTLNFKKEKVENILKKANINFPEIQVVANEEEKNYRNKLTLKIENGKVGFYQENSHDLIEINNCAIAKDSINQVLKNISKFNLKEATMTIRSNNNGELLLNIKTNENVKFREEEFQENKIVGMVINNKTVYGTPFFYERLNHFLFKVSFDAFFQVNPTITSKLYQSVQENIEKTENVLDLYAGVGTLGIIASSKAKKVYSIEIIKNAVLDNVENKKLNQSRNVYPILGDAEKVLPKIKEHFDTIILDPPRKGLDKNSLSLISESNAKKIIYISCDPMTLARDLKELQKKYTIEKFYILDMFSWTYHVECVSLLCLKNTSKSLIK